VRLGTGFNGTEFVPTDAEVAASHSEALTAQHATIKTQPALLDAERAAHAALEAELAELKRARKPKKRT
jgi:hypothetical protein